MVQKLFACPGCIERRAKDLRYRPVKQAHDVGGIHYCELCAEMLVDELTIALNEAAKKARVDFMHGGVRHSIRIKKNGPFFIMCTRCSCRETLFISECYPSYSAFWDAFSRFVEAHYVSLIATSLVLQHDTVPSHQFTSRMAMRDHLSHFSTFQRDDTPQKPLIAMGREPCGSCFSAGHGVKLRYQARFKKTKQKGLKRIYKKDE